MRQHLKEGNRKGVPGVFIFLKTGEMMLRAHGNYSAGGEVGVAGKRAISGATAVSNWVRGEEICALWGRWPQEADYSTATGRKGESMGLKLAGGQMWSWKHVGIYLLFLQ